MGAQAEKAMIEVFDCLQGSEEWWTARLGIPTASEFHTVLAKPQKGSTESKTRRDYLLKLAGEVITGAPMDSYSNANMERGKIMEDEARDLYAFAHDVEPTRIGFIKNGSKGCSPDSLIGDTGMVEIKTKFAHRTIDCILKDNFPPEHKAQCQGALWVAEREWIDITIYWPGLPLFVKRAMRDEPYIGVMVEEVDRFNDELAEIVAQVGRYGNSSALKAVLAQSVAAK
jgi:hypothetical protein